MADSCAVTGGPRLQPVPEAAAYLSPPAGVYRHRRAYYVRAEIALSALAQPVDATAFSPPFEIGWGISPAMDQQIGGLLMWVPGCLVYLTAILAMFARWYAKSEATRRNTVVTQWT